MVTKEMPSQLSELEKILEDVRFNPTSPFRAEEAEARHGEMTAGWRSRRQQKLAQCSLHCTGGPPASHTWERAEGRLMWTHRLPSLTSGVSESAGLGWGLQTCISDGFPYDSHVAGLRPLFKNH